MRMTSEQVQKYLDRIKGRIDVEAPLKKPKYRNKRVRLDGRTFASKLEARRYVELKQMEKAGLIFELKCQVPFELKVNGFLVCKYIADFVYGEHGLIMKTVEDAKGYATPEYLLKKRMMLAIHGITITEYRGRRRARKS